MKHLSRLSILLVALFVMAPAPANACIAVLAPVCDLITGGDILKAVTARVNAYVTTLLTEVGMKHDQKTREASDNNAQTIQKRAELAEAEREAPGPTGASCAIASMGMDFMRGGRANIAPVNPSQNYGGPAASGGGANGGGSPSLQPFTVPSPVNASRQRVPIGTALATTDTSSVPYERFTRAQVEVLESANQQRRDNELSPNQLTDAKIEFDKHQNNYYPSDSGNQKLFSNADISVQTIFDHDTFPATTNAPRDASKNPEGKSLTLYDAALDYCKNLAEPTVLPPNRGQAKAENTDRQIYSNERAGWDARLSLAHTICLEAAARRVAKDFPQMETSATGSTNRRAATPGDWFTSTLEAYRTMACGEGNDPERVACRDAVTALSTQAPKVSEFEMAKTIYTRMLFTPNASKLIGGANENDTMKMMLQLDQLQVMLNYRIYELQEKLTLIKSAQLATMVERDRTAPNAATPSSGQ